MNLLYGEQSCLKCKEPMTDQPVILALKAERHGWSVARLKRFQINYHTLGLCVAHLRKKPPQKPQRPKPPPRRKPFGPPVCRPGVVHYNCEHAEQRFDIS